MESVSSHYHGQVIRKGSETVLRRFDLQHEIRPDTNLTFVNDVVSNLRSAPGESQVLRVRLFRVQ